MVKTGDKEPSYEDMSVLGAALADKTEMKKLFKEWRRVNKRKYDSKKERKNRFKSFWESASRVYSLNTEPGRRATFALNKFSDWTVKEMRGCCGTFEYDDSQLESDVEILNTDEEEDI